MKLVGEVLAKAARHRRFHWCRRQSGFSDRPLWRVVASQLDMPLFQVLAFVNRLEEFANSAEQRGHVGDFSAAEFGAALGMSTDDASRIFAELESPEVGWIAYDHVTDFFARNPDREDETAAERMRRMRTRKRVLRELASLAARGAIDEATRRARELELKESREPERLLAEWAALSTVTRNTVTVTPEQSRIVTPLDPKTADGARGDKSGQPAGSPGSGAAELEISTAWLDSEGKQAIVERMQVTPLQAETQLQRWRRDLRDDVALANIIKGVTLLDRRGHSFQLFISDQVQRHVGKGGQQSLPLPPMAVTSKRGIA